MTNLADTEPQAAPGDVLLLRVIMLVGAIGVLSVLAIATLAGFERSVPDVLQSLATGSLVGLTGLLAARRGS